jgi:mono/diheme cytochrome c family protein
LNRSRRQPGALIRPRSIRLLPAFAAALLVATLLAGCDAMRNQPRYDPLEASQFYPDQRSARPLVEGTVPLGGKTDDEAGLSPRDEAGNLVDIFPFPVTIDVLQRGRERYDIFCSPCHGLDGQGKGMIVQRGFSPPPALTIERLQQAPAGYFYDVITNGFGQMYSYAYRVPPRDRWAIAAYIRALQLSQNATQGDVPPDALPQLQGTPQP